MEVFSQRVFLPEFHRPSAKVIPTLLASTIRESCNRTPFHKEQIAWWDNLPPVPLAPSLKKSRPYTTTKLCYGKHSPIIIFRHIYVFHQCICTREWSNIARNNVLCLQKTLLLVSFFHLLIGWLPPAAMSRSCNYYNPSVFALQITHLVTLVTGKFMKMWGFHSCQPHQSSDWEFWIRASRCREPQPLASTCADHGLTEVTNGQSWKTDAQQASRGCTLKDSQVDVPSDV
jgi:hypothetical protein